MGVPRSVVPGGDVVFAVAGSVVAGEIVVTVVVEITVAVDTAIVVVGCDGELVVLGAVASTDDVDVDVDVDVTAIGFGEVEVLAVPLLQLASAATQSSVAERLNVTRH